MASISSSSSSTSSSSSSSSSSSYRLFGVDSYITLGNAMTQDHNFGSSEYLILVGKGSRASNVVIKFDVEALTQGILGPNDIEDAVLNLRVATNELSGTAKYNLYALNKDWFAGRGAGGIPRRGEVTWTHSREAIQTWQKPGASGKSDVAEKLGSYTVRPNTNGWMQFDVTNYFRQVFAGRTDYGFLLKFVSGDAEAKIELASFEYSDPDDRPFMYMELSISSSSSSKSSSSSSKSSSSSSSSLSNSSLSLSSSSSSKSSISVSSSSSSSRSSSSRSSSSKSSSSKSSTSSSSLSATFLAEGCSYDYNAFKEGYTVDGDNITGDPSVVNIGDPSSPDPNNIAVVWVEPTVPATDVGTIYGCRFDGCNPLITATKIGGGGGSSRYWSHSTFTDLAYMYGEDRLAWVSPEGNSTGFRNVAWIIDATSMNVITGPIQIHGYTTPGDWEFSKVFGRENYFTVVIPRTPPNTPPDDVNRGIWKANYDYLGNVIGSLSLIKHAPRINYRPVSGQSTAHLLKDTSKFIMQTYYADYSLTDANDSQLEAIVLTSTGAPVNSNVVISQTTGNNKDAIACCTEYVAIPASSDYGFMVFFWEGDPTPVSTGTLSVRRFSKAGLPSGGVVELFDVSDFPSFGFRTAASATLMYETNNILITFMTTSFANRAQYMIINSDLEIVTPLTEIQIPPGIYQSPSSIRILPGFDLDRNYYIHTEEFTPEDDHNWILELTSISSSSSSTSSSSLSSSSESSSSSSKSSSSESTFPGSIIFLNQIYDGTGDYEAVWGDGNYVYAACGSDGLRSYSVDGAGNFSLIDHDYEIGYYNHVWGDGTFIYVAAYGSGILTYSVDGGGNLTYITSIYNGNNYHKVWGDGTFIYAAVGSSGVRSYSVDGGGNLTLEDTQDNGGNYYGVWGDGNFVYCACDSSGIRSYTVDGGGNFSLNNTQDNGGNYWDIWGDGVYIYAAAYGGGVKIYSVNESGVLTYITLAYNGGNTRAVYGDPCADLVYTANTTLGMRTYISDGAGNLTFIDVDDQGGFYNDIWSNGNIVFAATQTGGLVSYTIGGISCSSSSSSESSSSQSSSSSSNSSSSSSSSSSSAIPTSWTAYFDDTNWVGGTDNWFFAVPTPPTTWISGGPWWNAGVESGFIYNAYLITTGSWANGYRPTQMRVFHDSVSINFVMSLQDTTATNSTTGVIASGDLPYVSGTAVPITFASNDIWKLMLATNAGPFTVTNIEFA